MLSWPHVAMLNLQNAHVVTSNLVVQTQIWEGVSRSVYVKYGGLLALFRAY